MLFKLISVCVSFIDHFYVAHAIKTICWTVPFREFFGTICQLLKLSFRQSGFFSFTFVTIGGILFFFLFRKDAEEVTQAGAFNAYLVHRSSSLSFTTLPVHKMPIKITKHVFVVLSSFIFIQFIFVLSIFYNILIVLTFENCKWNYKNTQSTKSLTCIQGRYSSETIWISSFFFLAILVMRNCCIVSTNRQNRKFDLNNCQYSKHRSFVYFFLRFFSKT